MVDGRNLGFSLARETSLSKYLESMVCELQLSLEKFLTKGIILALYI